MIGDMDMSMFSGAPKREPSSDLRQAADDLHGMYTSYVDAGFTKQQAMQIVCSIISSSVANQRPSSD